MKNGLYSVHVDLMDGRAEKGSGVVVFREGRILGGDAYLYYVGSYVLNPANSTFKGELTIMQHTRNVHETPIFSGQLQPVGIGVTGTYTNSSATVTGVALVGKESQIFNATLRMLVDA